LYNLLIVYNNFKTLMNKVQKLFTIKVKMVILDW